MKDEVKCTCYVDEGWGSLGLHPYCSMSEGAWLGEGLSDPFVGGSHYIEDSSYEGVPWVVHWEEHSDEKGEVVWECTMVNDRPWAWSSLLPHKGRAFDEDTYCEWVVAGTCWWSYSRPYSWRTTWEKMR